MPSVRGALAGLVIGVSTVLVVLAVSLVPFLNPVWVGFEQGRAGAAALTGFDTADLRGATDAILSDLVLGPPDFAVEVAGVPVLGQAERGHMRDVRGVFTALCLAALAGALVLVAAFVTARGRSRATLWRRVSRSGLVIAAVTVVGGLVALAFFDRAFLLFHEVFFPQGNFLFDPSTARLVQLFPEQFWVETSVGVGLVVVVVSLAVAWVGRWRATAIEARTAGASGSLSAVPVP